MISTHTMTGAVNLSSNRNNMLTNMAITSPLTQGSDKKKKFIQTGRFFVFLHWDWNLLNIHYLHQDPWPRRCKILKDLDTYISGTETIQDVPD